jgi:hypothetical protein
MIAQYGMEVFPKFFRRAVQLNADYIFNNSSQTPQGSYDLLSKYVQKIKLDPQEADNVADSIDTTEGDLFKNFDVSKFMDHFKLDPVAKSMLALSLKNSSKPDLRTKGKTRDYFYLLACSVRFHSCNALLLSYITSALYFFLVFSTVYPTSNAALPKLTLTD